MPQMFPLNWIILFTFFIMLLLASMTLTFFLSIPILNTKSHLLENPTQSFWKW
uniref:ATP synthase F0 subunit 8 n=1 Tax=Scutigerella causeyae TaxID=388540 RepID=Q06RG3_9MYRI|nr:ATP synthase F0 subunit 8 [Scutigerella causeyae]ABF93304.1 ATP synthase F0 subunit 8 [Scutigerella causeyae]